MKLFILFLFCSHLGATPLEDEKAAKNLVHLLNYLSQDYKEAVREGQVINQFEYEEQIEFAEKMGPLVESLPPLASDPEIRAHLTSLRRKVETKADYTEIQNLSQKIKSSVIQKLDLKTSPERWPDLVRGARLYRQNCASCHGEAGDGQGPLAKGMQPPPVSFLDLDRMSGLTPFQAFVTVDLGIEGTQMVPMTHLKAQEKWDLAFFVSSIRHGKVGPPSSAPQISLSEVASLSDRELKDKYSDQVIQMARTHSESHSRGMLFYLEIARARLDEAVNSSLAGDVKAARNQALAAYLDGIEPVEPSLKDSGFLKTLEQSMVNFRKAVESGEEPEMVKNLAASAHVKINEAEKILSNKTTSLWHLFWATLGIVLREGLESILIVIATLSVVRAKGSKRAERWIHGGWIGAVAVGGVAWLFSGWILNMGGAAVETLEAWVSFFAVAVLLYMGFWMHRQSEISRWNHYVQEKVEKSISTGSMVGLGLIAFVSVFRESFETVLFLRAITLDVESNYTFHLLSGFLTALALVGTLTFVFLKLTRSLPFRPIFLASSLLMLLLSVTLMGKGIRALQEVGSLSITPFGPRVSVDILGLHFTKEGLVAQGLILIICVLLFQLSGALQKTSKANT